MTAKTWLLANVIMQTIRLSIIFLGDGTVLPSNKSPSPVAYFAFSGNMKQAKTNFGSQITMSAFFDSEKLIKHILHAKHKRKTQCVRPPHLTKNSLCETSSLNTRMLSMYASIFESLHTNREPHSSATSRSIRKGSKQ